MNIYNANGEPVLSVTPSGSSQRTRKIMRDNSLTLIFESTDFIEIPLYSYIDYEGERYTLWRPEDFTKNGDRIWEYAVKFGGWQEFLKTRMFKFLSAVPHELKFPITAKPDALVQILVDNLNENSSGWTKGEVIDATEKTLSFNYEYCYDALNRIAEEFSTEWEIQGKTIHLRKVEKNKTNPVPLKYGKDNGLRPGIVRKVKKEKAPVTKLYVQGGERNINRSAYGSKSLLLPTDRTLQYEGRTYRTDPSGMFITRADRTLTVYNEDGFDATHIYPSRVGTVSQVITVDAEQNFYDFKDSSIPADLNFSDCRIPGEKATVIFQTGVLAGKEFDIEQTDDDLTGYVHAERRFKLVPLDEDGTVYPNENCKPHVGDQYAVFNISLPQAYVRDDATQTGASWDMFREAVKYMYENEDELFTITGELSSLFAKENWLDIGGRIVPGGYIAFSDDRFMQEATLIRITGIAEPLERPWKATLELSNVSIAGNILTGLGKLEAEEVYTALQNKQTRLYMKRSWRDAIETLHLVENSLLENFTVAISPIAIQSMAILLGDKNLQFRFVNNKTNPQRVEHVVTFNNTTKVLFAPAGIIQHQTLGISEVSSSHKASEYKYWNIPAYTSPPLDDAKAYYLYAKVSATNQTGTFVLSETAKAMNADAGYYYLWIGQINSAYDGVRSDFMTFYGFTEITPGQITTPVIRDADAKLVIDLANARITAQNGAEIVGKITFSNGSSGLENLDEWAETDKRINDAQDAADTLEYYVDHAFKDGIIEASEALAIETLINNVNATADEITATYNQLYASAYLTAAQKSTLASKKSAFDTAKTNLINAINSAIADGLTTTTEKANVDAKFDLFKTALSNLSDALSTAQKQIDNYLLAEIGAVQDATDELEGYVDGAFKDGIITVAEAKAIATYINNVNAAADEITATYNQLYASAYLTAAQKSTLASKKSAFDTAKTNLINAINSAIADGLTTTAEKANVDAKFDLFKTALSNLSDALSTAQKQIDNYLLAEIGAVQDATDELEGYVDGAFKDGIITVAEAKAIAMYINNVNAAADEITATYNQIYASSYLNRFAEKYARLEKSAFDTAKTNLINAINSAIADGLTTTAEKANVDAKFALFKTALANLSDALSTAQKQIDTYLANNTADALTKAENAQTSANTAQSTANAKPNVFYGTTAPSSSSGRKTGDLWVDGSKIWRFNGSTWAEPVKYDVTETVINGGLITTGVITFGTTGGMTASGTIRIWAGGSNSTPSGATFRVYSDGSVYARNSVRVEDPNGTVVCGFSSDGTNTGTVNDLSYPGSIRIWAGGSDPTTANFRVSHAGTVNAKFFVTKGISGYMDQYGFNFRDGTNDKNYGYLTTSGGTTFQVSASTLPLQLVCAGSVSQVALKMINTAGNNAQFMLGYLQHGSEWFGHPYIKMTNPLWKHYSEFSGHQFRNVVWDEETGYIMVEQ